MFLTRMYTSAWPRWCAVSVKASKHFDSGGLPSLSDVHHSVELRGRHGSKLLGTPVKGIIKELDNRPFVVALGHRRGSMSATLAKASELDWAMWLINSPQLSSSGWV